MEGEHSPLHDITFSSSHAVIEYARKLLDNSISISIDPKLDMSKPSLLCANHFTRIETFFMPSYIYKKLDVRVRSLADKHLFSGIMGDYLTSAGVLSTDDPNRDKIISTDLMKGSIEWIIYPEGSMVKDKNISCSKDGFFIESENRTVFTGASTIALKSEMARAAFKKSQKNGDIKTTANMRKLYDIDSKDVSSTSIQIVPITITYFPLRTGHNKIIEMINSLLTLENKKTIEEIEVESNILLKSNMHIHLGEAINVGRYIKTIRKNLYSKGQKEITDDYIIEKYRNDLTTQIMQRIYKNIYINFDHIFALLLEKYPYETIRITQMKSIIFLCGHKLSEYELCNVHNMLHRDFYKLLVDEPFEMFDTALELAIKQKILILQDDGGYKIDKDALANQHDFHTVRIKNTFRVVLNEIKMFTDLHQLIQEQANRNFADVQQEVFQIISKQDKHRFDYYYKQYYSLLQNQSKDIGAPFMLIDKSYTKGIVLSHGYKSSPGEVRELAEFLHKQGFNVYAVRLEGHGTDPEDLKDTVYEQWIDSFNRGFAALRQISKKLYLCGFSVGGVIAIYVATSKKHKVDGLICINTAIEINDMAFNYVLPTLGIVNSWLSIINAHVEYIEDPSEYPDTNYDKHHISSMLELKKLIEKTKERLHTINAPTLIIQSTHDPIVNPQSAQIIYDNIDHDNKHLECIDAEKHIIIRSDEKYIVFDMIKKFLEKYP